MRRVRFGRENYQEGPAFACEQCPGLDRGFTIPPSVGLSSAAGLGPEGRKQVSRPLLYPAVPLLRLTS